MMEDRTCAMLQEAAGKYMEAPRNYTCFLHEDRPCGEVLYSDSKPSIDQQG